MHTDDCSQCKYPRRELVPSVIPDWCSELVRKHDQQKVAVIMYLVPRVIVNYTAIDEQIVQACGCHMSAESRRQETVAFIARM